VSNPPLTHEAALQQVLAAYQTEFDDAVQHWRSIEGKAQASVAIAGIFLAAGFALVRELDPATMWWVRCLLLLAALCLIAAVVFAVFALKVRTVAAPPPADALKKLVEDLFRDRDPKRQQVQSQDFDEEIRNFRFDCIRMWKESTSYAEETIRRKAKQLRRAQLALLAAIAVVATLTAGAILLPGQFGGNSPEKGAKSCTACSPTAGKRG
jgi:hypothetical protein